MERSFFNDKELMDIVHKTSKASAVLMIDSIVIEENSNVGFSANPKKISGSCRHSLTYARINACNVFYEELMAKDPT